MKKRNGCVATAKNAQAGLPTSGSSGIRAFPPCSGSGFMRMPSPAHGGGSVPDSHWFPFLHGKAAGASARHQRAGALRDGAAPRRQKQNNTGRKHEARQKRHANERKERQGHKKRACREIPTGPFRSKPRYFASGAASAGFSAGAGAGSGAGAFSSVAAGLMLSNSVSLYFQSA